MTYREASAFFLRNIDLLQDFILKYLSTKQKLTLLEVLQQEFAKDRSFSLHETIGNSEKTQCSNLSQVRQSVGRSSRYSRNSEIKNSPRKSLGDGTIQEIPENATKYRLQDFQSMGIFFNPENLPKQMQATLAPQRRTVRKSIQRALLPAMQRLSILSDRSLSLTDGERMDLECPTRKKSRSSVAVEGLTTSAKDDRMTDTLSRSLIDHEFLPPETDEINEEEWERIIFQAHLDKTSDSPRPTVFHLHESVTRSFSLPVLAHNMTTAINSGKFTRNEIVQSLVNNLLTHVPANGIHLHLLDGQSVVLFKSHEPRKSFYMVPPDLKVNQTTPTLHALHTGEILVANKVHEDGRFSAQHMKTDRSMEHVVDYPLYSLDGNVAAIIEVQRNAVAGPFKDEDVKLIHAFAHEAQMALLLREKMLREAKQATHHLFIKKIVGVLFSQIRNLDNVIKTTMVYAKVLTKASRATLFLLDKKKQELVSTILDLGDLNKPKFMSVNQIRISVETGIAGYVTRTGNPLITNNPESNEHFYEAVDRESGYKTRNIIAVPIKVDGQ
uniref:GAF domain-containing protein n=1 Tax=Schistocephalus solidus TaxID=70667 RepID=A0A0X3NW40_SCHSO